MNAIKLSDFTKKVLTNVADFNGGVIINKTTNNKTTIETMSPSGDLFLTVDIPEDFEYDFTVSDLSRFLSIYSTLEDPEIGLHKSFMDLQSNKTKARIKYCYADQRAIVTPPGIPQVGDEIVTVDISKETLDKIKKQASILQLPHIQFSVENSKLVCIAKDCSNPSSNVVTHELGDANGIEINEEVFIKTESLKIIPEDYQVTVCENAVKFSPLNNNNMTYVVARYID